MNNNDIMFITFKLKTFEELLEKISIKIDNLDENFKFLKSDFDFLQINNMASEIQDELDIILREKKKN
jgi:hypothetical protein